MKNNRSSSSCMNIIQMVLSSHRIELHHQTTRTHTHTIQSNETGIKMRKKDEKINTPKNRKIGNKQTQC